MQQALAAWVVAEAIVPKEGVRRAGPNPNVCARRRSRRWFQRAGTRRVADGITARRATEAVLGR